MTLSTQLLTDICAAMVSEAASRLAAATTFLESFSDGKGVGYVEASALQLRKALEAMAFAAIAPNHSAYAAHRAKAENNQDFTKDYHVKRIFNDLGRINPDFYPVAVLPGKNIAPKGRLAIISISSEGNPAALPKRNLSACMTVWASISTVTIRGIPAMRSRAFLN